METLPNSEEADKFRYLASLAAKNAEWVKDNSTFRTSIDRYESFFTVAFLNLYGQEGCFGRGGGEEFYGHLLYHVSSAIDKATRREIKVMYVPLQFMSPDDPFPPSIAIETVDGTDHWTSLEDWRNQWEADPYHTIPDISVFQREIGSGSPLITM